MSTPKSKQPADAPDPTGDVDWSAVWAEFDLQQDASRTQLKTAIEVSEHTGDHSFETAGAVIDDAVARDHLAVRKAKTPDGRLVTAGYRLPHGGAHGG